MLRHCLGLLAKHFRDSGVVLAHFAEDRRDSVMKTLEGEAGLNLVLFFEPRANRTPRGSESGNRPWLAVAVRAERYR